MEWKQVFECPKRLGNLESVTATKIKPIQVYDVGDEIKVIFDNHGVILTYHGNAAAKFSYEEFDEFLECFNYVNEGWCDMDFKIGEHIRINYWREEEAHIMEVYDSLTTNYIYLEKSELYLFLEHVLNLYYIVNKYLEN